MIVDPTGEPRHDTPSVGATNWNGGLTATRHLLALGHTRIAVIGGPEDILCSRARLDGYRAAMDAAGVAIDPELVSHGRFHVEEGIDRARVLLRMPRSADRHRDRRRSPGAGRLPGRARASAPHPGGPERRRVRRPAGRPLGRSATDHDPPATGRDGRDRRRARPRASPAASGRTQARVELSTELIVRESTAPPSR